MTVTNTAAMPTSAHKIRPRHLDRLAIVYVRQSTPPSPGGGRWIVLAGAAAIKRLRRLRAFEVKHHGRRKPPPELTTPSEPKPSRRRKTPERSGGK